MTEAETVQHLLTNEVEALNEISWIMLDRWRHLTGHKYLFTERELRGFRQVMAETLAGMMGHYGTITGPVNGGEAGERRRLDGIAGRIEPFSKRPADRRPNVCSGSDESEDTAS
jgi:hypothetical protein